MFIWVVCQIAHRVGWKRVVAWDCCGQEWKSELKGVFSFRFGVDSGVANEQLNKEIIR